jgi:hypothetical protein
MISNKVKLERVFLDMQQPDLGSKENLSGAHTSTLQKGKKSVSH